jgi:hypothetical protein
LQVEGVAGTIQSRKQINNQAKPRAVFNPEPMFRKGGRPFRVHPHLGNSIRREPQRVLSPGGRIRRRHDSTRIPCLKTRTNQSLIECEFNHWKQLMKSKRSLIPIVLLLGVSLLGLPAALQAQFAFTTNNGAITITGYAGDGGAVIIPGETNGYPIRGIGNQAFYSKSNVTSVLIPESIIMIGSSSFARCVSLTAITVHPLNTNYSSIDGILFDKGQVTLIQYPGGRIGDGHFSVTDGVTSVGNAAFSYCTMLASISLPASVTNVGSSAFQDCTSLAHVTLGSVTSIKSTTFYNCTGLTNLTIPDSVTSIGPGAFQSCTNLTMVTLGNGVIEIMGKAFANCTRLASITIPNSVTNLGPSAFEYCASLTNATLSNHLISLGDWTFYRCSNLASLIIPDSVVVYGSGVFRECSSLTSVVIGNGVTYIMDYAFGGCPHLRSVILGTNVCNIGPGAFLGTALTNIVIPNTVTNLGGRAFQACTNLTRVVLGNRLATIGINAFWGCSSLTGLTIPRSVTNLGYAAFENCTNLAGVYFQGSAPSADGATFNNDLQATVYYLPGAMNWNSTFGGRPAVLWNPQFQTSDASFGMRNNQFCFKITGTADIPVVLEACTNLLNPVWQPLQSCTLTNGALIFSDPNWTNDPARLYRIRSP